MQMASSMRVSIPLLAVFLLASLAPTTCAFKFRGAVPKVRQHAAPNNVPYKQRCPVKKSALGLLTAETAKVNSTVMVAVPGTGMNPEAIKAEFTAGKIYKDGFYTMGCIKDYMYYKGDKFGDNKYDYELEQISNVSIVFPTSYVPKEDQEPMTVSYCYNMCRQLENMNFFGIVNGRDCYCAPYVKPMAGDDSVCTAVCDGDKGAICGSKTKSSIFEMHSCDDTSTELSASIDLAQQLMGRLRFARALEAGAKVLDKRADKMKEAFGKVGDPEASNLFQETETVASDLMALVTKVKELDTKMSGTADEGVDLQKADLSVIENAAKADSIMATLAEEMVTAEKLIDEMKKTSLVLAPTLGPDFEKEATNASKQYYPIMYFEDKKFEKSPTTCSGKLLRIYYGVTEDSCARSCDLTDTDGCIGFLFVPGAKNAVGPLPSNACFTFSSITSMQYYTKPQCPASDVMCYGKLSKLEGTTPLDKEKGQKAVEADSRCMPDTV